jgi:hypothetical protein
VAGDICMVELSDGPQEKVRDALKADYEYPQEDQNYDGTYLFFSFDLVNSTAFKNKNSKWGKIFDRFFIYCKDEMKKSFPSVVTWKMIGDEILFYLRVIKENELYDAPSKTFKVLKGSIDFLDSIDDAKSYLSVKATLWAAAMRNSADNVINRIIIERDFDNDILDFLGPDIDIGFRISEYALKSILVVEAKLACLLTKLETELDKEHISTHMKIVSYEKLKGVWDGRYYPIVWYRDNWTYSNSMFIYDEKYNSKIVQHIEATKGECLDDVSGLTKVFLDLNKIAEIEWLKNNIASDGNIVRVQKKVSRDKLSEVHIVAICLNSKDEILIAKRTEKDTLPNTWEFGCSQLHMNQEFIAAINENYQKDFGITVEYLQKDPIPIGMYHFKKKNENDRIVPGIIFVCRILSGEDNIVLDVSKHSQYRFIGRDTYKDIMNASECVVDDFERRIIGAYNLIEQIKDQPHAQN